LTGEVGVGKSSRAMNPEQRNRVDLVTGGSGRSSGGSVGEERGGVSSG